MSPPRGGWQPCGMTTPETPRPEDSTQRFEVQPGPDETQRLEVPEVPEEQAAETRQFEVPEQPQPAATPAPAPMGAPEEPFGPPAGSDPYKRPDWGLAADQPAPATPWDASWQPDQPAPAPWDAGWQQPPPQGYQPPSPGQPQYGPPQYGQPQYGPPQYGYQDPYARSRVVAGVLGILLGAFGVHNFYLGYNDRAWVQLGCSLGSIAVAIATLGILGFLPGIVIPGIAIWGLIEGILFLTQQTGHFSMSADGRPLRA